jgi:hypothetical protein
VRLLTFTPAATILHLVAHATTCLLNGFRLLHLVDVAWAAPASATTRRRRGDSPRPGASPRISRACWRWSSACSRSSCRSGRRPRRPRPLFGTATVESFLLDAAGVDQRSAADRLWREIVWSVSMGCVPQCRRHRQRRLGTRPLPAVPPAAARRLIGVGIAVGIDRIGPKDPDTA